MHDDADNTTAEPRLCATLDAGDCMRDLIPTREAGGILRGQRVRAAIMNFMKGTCILVWFGIATCGAAIAAEPAPGSGALPAATTPTNDGEAAPAEQWHYHEKWDKALQRGLVPPSRGAAPATECRPSAGTDRGIVRPSPVPPARCPDAGVRVRT